MFNFNIFMIKLNFIIQNIVFKLYIFVIGLFLNLLDMIENFLIQNYYFF